MFNIIDPIYTSIDYSSVKITINIVVILFNNYNKFFNKLYKKLISLDNLKSQILNYYYNFIDI